MIRPLSRVRDLLAVATVVLGLSLLAVGPIVTFEPTAAVSSVSETAATTDLSPDDDPAQVMASWALIISLGLGTSTAVLIAVVGRILWPSRARGPPSAPVVGLPITACGV